MTQSTIAQFLYVVDVVDPFLHVSVLGGIFLVLLQDGIQTS